MLSCGKQKALLLSHISLWTGPWPTMVVIDRNLLRRQLPVVLIRQILSDDENHQFYVVKMVQNSSLEHRGQHFIFRNHDHKSKNAIKRSWRGSAVVVRIVGIHNWNCAAS